MLILPLGLYAASAKSHIAATTAIPIGPFCGSPPRLASQRLRLVALDDAHGVHVQPFRLCEEGELG